MVPWIELDRATMPGDGGTLRLMQRGAEFSIMAGRLELMNSRRTSSEEVLAELTCGRIRERPKPKILIGGLGMGFTLRAALAALGDDAKIVVAELVPEVIAWARGPMAVVFGSCLSDPRAEIRQADVADAIRAEKAGYDAILLDVDNGPEGLTRKANDGLYGGKGLQQALAALRPGGVFAVWSAWPDSNFAHRLKMAGFAVEEHKARARGARGGARHVIWIGTKGAAKGAGVADLTLTAPASPSPLRG